MNLSYPALSDDRYRVRVRSQVFEHSGGERVVHADRTKLYAVIESRPLLSFLPWPMARPWFCEAELTGDAHVDEKSVNSAMERIAQRFEDEKQEKDRRYAASRSKGRILAEMRRL